MVIFRVQYYRLYLTKTFGKNKVKKNNGKFFTNFSSKLISLTYFVNALIVIFRRMELPSKYLSDAVDQLATLPSIGKRSALRLILDLLKRSPEEVEQFSQSFIKMKENIKFCSNCGNISDSMICAICTNPKRDQSIICIVEDARDVLAIESTRSFAGIYHVLGGLISPMDGIGPDDLNINSLIEKSSNQNIKEIIFALNSSMEGDTTNYYLYKKLKHLAIPFSVISRGISVGTELHYADELTLGRSIQQRLPFESTFI
jgi:recombination protein RecR